MGDYGFPGDVSVDRQNRIRETYFGCGAPGSPCASNLKGAAIASGSYMGAIGKVVSMGGLRGMNAPTTQAQRELAQFGIGRAPSVAIAMGGLGDGTRDKAMCQASFGAGQAGVGVATGYHTASAGTSTPDAGWTTALGISSALMTVGGAMCNFIDTGEPTTPTGQAYNPQSLYNQNVPPSTAAQPNWLLIGGVGVGALVVGYLLFGK